MIQAEATTPVNTGVVFWSHDKGTAKLIFRLKKDHINQNLSQGTIVPILLEFNSTTASNGRGRHIYHAVIEDVLEGIVSIVLEDNILGYVGRVDGSVYIELPDSRSLDTAGRFTFDIKRSPIDEDVPELEDYYWQGFNEIIQESKRLIDQVESDCKIVLDNLNSKVTVLETQTTDIKNKQAEILKSIEEHDVFTKQESSVNVINQVAGNESSIIPQVLNVDGNNVKASRLDNGVLIEFNQQDYIDLLSKNSAVRTESLINGQSAEIDFSFDLIKIIEELYPYMFNGLTTSSQKLEMLKSVLKAIRVPHTARGRVSSKFDWFNNYVSSWSNINLVNTSSDFIEKIYEVKEFTESTFGRLFGNTGTFKCRLYSGSVSDGSNTSWIEVKDLRLIIDIETSAKKIIDYAIAANHVENLATQAEAEAGEDNTKTMTPLRVFQSIAQWTKNKFISLTENETVLGIKNFANGLQVGGNNVLSQNGEIRFVTNSTNNSSLESGSIVFKRYGDDVDIYANFQVRASGDLTRDMNIVAESIVDDIFEPGENFSFFVGSETAQAVVKFVGKGIKAHSTLTKGIWYVGTASYKAKNKL